MSDNVVSFGNDSHPHSNALITAFEKAIDDIANGKMTNVEVMGCLEVCKMNVMMGSLEPEDG